MRHWGRRCMSNAWAGTRRTFLDTLGRIVTVCRELEGTNWAGRSPLHGSMVRWRPMPSEVLAHLFRNAAKPQVLSDRKRTLGLPPTISASSPSSGISCQNSTQLVCIILSNHSFVIRNIICTPQSSAGYYDLWHTPSTENTHFNATTPIFWKSPLHITSRHRRLAQSCRVL